MTKEFCKIFRSDKYGQILIVSDTDSDTTNPCVSISFTASGLGVCSTSFGFDDDDEGWGKRDKLFEKMDKGMATDIVGPIISKFNGLPSET